MSVSSDAHVYRPGYNPAFVAKVMKNRRQREQQERARQVFKSVEAPPRVVMRAISEADVIRIEKLAERKRKAAEAILEAHRVLHRIHGKTSYARMTTSTRRICAAVGVTPAEVLSNRRNKRMVFARQA